MAANKTTETNASVTDYLARIEEQTRRHDCTLLAELLTEATGEPSKMWGAGIVGFGKYSYRYESGREGEMCLVGFSSRKADITLYGLGMGEVSGDLLARLGKHKTGKGCLYVKKLGDIDVEILKQLVANAVARKKATSGAA